MPYFSVSPDIIYKYIIGIKTKHVKTCQIFISSEDNED